MRPGEVRYLLLLFMFGNTYFCRFEEVLGLNPAFRAVFNKVFLANPLQNYKYWSTVRVIIQNPNNFIVCDTVICNSSVPTYEIHNAANHVGINDGAKEVQRWGEP